MQIQILIVRSYCLVSWLLTSLLTHLGQYLALSVRSVSTPMPPIKRLEQIDTVAEFITNEAL